MNLDDDKTLVALAAAMVQYPRATYQDLAVAIGVSRATLYRKLREMGSTPAQAAG